MLEHARECGYYIGQSVVARCATARGGVYPAATPRLDSETSSGGGCAYAVGGSGNKFRPCERLTAGLVSGWSMYRGSLIRASRRAGTSAGSECLLWEDHAVARLRGVETMLRQVSPHPVSLRGAEGDAAIPCECTFRTYVLPRTNASKNTFRKKV